MGLILYANFFACLFVAVNHAEAAAVGEACSVANDCTGDILCDKIHNKCLIKAGESCATNADKCVSHASCGERSTCACDTGYTVNQGLCDANIGTVCNASVSCVDTSVCDNLFGKCLVKDSASCEAPNADKCVSHATCTGDSCGCNTEYAANAAGLCEAKIGTACNASVGCIATSVCDNVFGKCLVKDSASCAAPNADKCVSHATCTNNLCGCNDGYTSNTAGLCEANIGTACNVSVRCVTSYVCDKVSGKCYADAAAAGDACSAAVQCDQDLLCDQIHNKCLIKVTASCDGKTDKCVSHAVCGQGVDKSCECDTGYTVNAGLCDANINTMCNASVHCVDTSVCDNVFGKCLIKAGESCANNIDKCVSNATCSDSTCGCRNGYTDNEEGLCVIQTNNKGRTPGISMSALVCMLLSGMCLTILMM